MTTTTEQPKPGDLSISDYYNFRNFMEACETIRKLDLSWAAIGTLQDITSNAIRNRAKKDMQKP